MDDRVHYIENFTITLENFEKQMREFFTEVKKTMQINEEKLENMQGQINYT